MKNLSEQFNSISVKKGEYFTVELKSNGGSTGYLWDVAVTAGQATVVKKEYVELHHTKTPEEKMPGRTMVDRTLLRAEETGTIELVANYRRPWEKTTPPARSHRFTVKVD